MASFEVPGSGGQFFCEDKGHPWAWLPTGVQMTLDFVAPKGHGPDARNIVVLESTIAVTIRERTPSKLRFSIKAETAGAFHVQAQDAHGHKMYMGGFAGEFKNQPGMDIDLLAKLCRAGDALKILRVQQLLSNQRENIFNQKSHANVQKYGNMMCGAVAKGRAIELFGDVSTLAYQHPYHEPLGTDHVSSRTQVKYRSAIITKARHKIVSLLAKGTPVRVGVLDSPVGMMTHNHRLIAWESGGHTVVIVGCDNVGMNFMYVDPWLGGSVMTYAGGIMGPAKCRSMGIFQARHNLKRKAGHDPMAAPNLLVQRSDTYGAFSAADGSFLEVVAGPAV
jgi:hypothetical protein